MANVVTPEFRVSYPKVFKPELNSLSGKTEYSIVALFPKGADLSALKKAAQDAAVERWGEDKTKWPKNLRLPFRDQAEKEKDGVLPAGHEAGAIFMSFKSAQKPGVVDQNVQDIVESSQFYGGCFARASVGCYAYDQAGNRGIGFGLGNIQKTREGESFGGRTAPQNDFAPVVSAGSPVTSANSLFD